MGHRWEGKSFLVTADSVLIISRQQKWSTKHNVPHFLFFFCNIMSTFAVDVKVLPQLFSSELSTQSFTWSHLYWLGIHWPSWQVNWSDLHVCPPGGKSYLLTVFKRSTTLPRSCACHRHTTGSLFIRAVLAVFLPIADKPGGDAFPACHTLEFLRAARRRCCRAHKTTKKVNSFVIVTFLVF